MAMNADTYDVIVVGGGPAGLTAALYASRHNLKTLLLEGVKVGGRALDAHWVENYPGFPDGISGHDLMQKFIEQVNRFGVEVRNETVIGFSDFGELKMVSTRQGYHQGKTIILATGVNRRQLSVPGENEFRGRGVSYCAVCDGPFFRDKIVAVVGGGHEAVHDAETLSEIVSKVYALPGLKGYNGDISEVQRIRSNPKIELIEGRAVKEIIGTDLVKGLILDNGIELDVDGVFVILERVSTSEILKDVGVATDEGGCIIVDDNGMTNVNGIYAAGDCSCRGMQIVTATGMGARAALSAMKHVRSVKT
jgi:thioredoxin reductase (NADPH)